VAAVFDVRRKTLPGAMESWIGKEPLKLNELEQVRIEKAGQLLRDLLQLLLSSTSAARSPVLLEAGFGCPVLLECMERLAVRY
jgi:hypothetical protein